MIQFVGISKSYGQVRALDAVAFEIEEGEIHAVLGENGAGKSTLMGILSGFVKPDEGEIRFGDHSLPFGNPLKTKRLGIEMVHQHFTLVPAFSAQENLALYRLDGLSRRANSEALSREALALAEQLGWHVPANDAVRDLPVGTQQRVEILKALSREAAVLILDEPTAVLSPSEIDNLFSVLRTLREKGKTVLLIAHKLSEVMRIADRATVLRKGKWIATAMVAETDEKTLAEWMVGAMPETIVKTREAAGEPVLKVHDLHVLGDRKEERVQGLSFSLSKGEVLGIGGVEGNGQIELAECLAQIRGISKGSIIWERKPLTKAKPRLGYIPQDRQADGLALTMSITDNLLIEGHRRPNLRVGFVLLSGRIRKWSRDLASRFAIAYASLTDPVGSLSGGNQQKVVVARALDSTPDLLIAVNPTRGLDLQATNYVHRQILEARDNGSAIILFSTDLDELALLADRILYLSGGLLADSLVGGPI